MCTHNHKIGDNYGFTCLICGQVLEGFGHNHTSAQCVHSWYAEENMLLAVCMYCEATTPNPNYLTIEDAEANAGGAFAD